MKRVKYFFFFFILLAAAGLFFVESFLKSEPITLAQGEEKMIKLPSPVLAGEISLEEAIEKRRSVRTYKDEALTLEEVSNLLWAASGITADWGGRAAPSAGALYPLDVYLVSGEVEGLTAGIYRYLPESHALVVTVEGDRRSALHAASLLQDSVKKAPVSIALCAEYGRITPRYRDRAKRYTKIEVGHIGQNIYLQAESLGLATVAIGAFKDGAVQKVLAVEQDPLYIMPIGRKQ